MSIDPIFWLLAAVGFLALEGMTFSMVSVWFAAGSAAAQSEGSAAAAKPSRQRRAATQPPRDQPAARRGQPQQRAPGAARNGRAPKGVRICVLIRLGQMILRFFFAC